MINLLARGNFLSLRRQHYLFCLPWCLKPNPIIDLLTCIPFSYICWKTKSLIFQFAHFSEQPWWRLKPTAQGSQIKIPSTDSIIFSTHFLFCSIIRFSKGIMQITQWHMGKYTQNGPWLYRIRWNLYRKEVCLHSKSC